MAPPHNSRGSVDSSSVIINVSVGLYVERKGGEIARVFPLKEVDASGIVIE